MASLEKMLFNTIMLAINHMEFFKYIFNAADGTANFCYWLQVRAGGVAASIPSYI